MTLLTATVILLSGLCHGSGNVTVTMPPSPPATSNGNDTITAVAVATIGKPSKFDEHVEDWQYVDEPLKNNGTAAVTALAVAGNATTVNAAAVAAGTTAAPVCKICLLAKNKSRRNKRNHDGRLLKLAAKSSRRRELYAELLAVAASKQSFRCKRFRRSTAADATAATADSSQHVSRFKRYRRSAAADAAGQSSADVSERPSYRRAARFGRSAAAYPNAAVRPYRYGGDYHHHHYQQQQQRQQQQHPSALAADLRSAQNRRWRYRYAADPYQYRRNTMWDRSAEFRRRYLRFPAAHDGPPPAYGNIIGGGGGGVVNGAVNPWSPSALAAVPPPPPPQQLPPQQLQQQPFAYLPQYPVQQQPPPPPPPLPPQPMGPRSPRLVFRDPVDQGTLQAPYGGPNGLQDLLVQQQQQPDDIKGQYSVCRRLSRRWSSVFYSRARAQVTRGRE